MQKGKQTKNNYVIRLYIESRDKDIWINFSSTREEMLEISDYVDKQREEQKSEEARFVEILEIMSSKSENLKIFFSEEALDDYNIKGWREAQAHSREEKSKQRYNMVLPNDDEIRYATAKTCGAYLSEYIDKLEFENTINFSIELEKTDWESINLK